MKMKRMKKPVVLLVAVILIFSVLVTGCGKVENEQTNTQAANTQTESTSGSESTAAEATKEELKQVELSWYMGVDPQADTELVEEEMNKTLLKEIKATIKVNFVPWGNYIEKMNVLSASGDKFDLCYSAGWMGFGPMVTKGAYAALNDLLPEYAPDYLKIVPEYLFEAATVQGKILAMPNLQALAMPVKLYVRADLYDKYNAPAKISNYDELDEFFTQIAANEKGVVPTHVYAGSATGINAPNNEYFEINGSSVGAYTKDFTVINQYETDAMKTFLRWRRKAYLNGWIEKNAPTMKGEDTNALKAGKYASMFSNGGPQNEQNAQANYGPTYAWKAIDIGIEPVIYTGNLQSTMTSVNVNSDNKERAVMFVNLLWKDVKLFNTVCNGVEGKHFALKDGFKELPEGVAADKIGYNPGIAWAMGNSFTAYLDKGADPDVYKRQQEYDKTATAEPAAGFVFDPTPVKTQMAQVDSVFPEYCAALVAGSVDPDTELPKLLDAIQKAGADDIIAEKQKQLNEWKAANGK